MLSRSTPEYAVRRMVRAISSAIDSSVLRKSSKPIGSAAMSDPLFFGWKVDDDVAMRVERGARPRRDHAGRIVLLHDARPLPRRHEIGPIDDRGLAPAELGAEIDGPRAAGAPGPDAIHMQGVRNARAIRDAEADHAQAHDLHGLLGSRAVAVRPLVLAPERLVDLRDGPGVGCAAGDGHGQLERLALVTAVRQPANAARLAGEAFRRELGQRLRLHPPEGLGELGRRDVAHEASPRADVVVLDV